MLSQWIVFSALMQPQPEYFIRMRPHSAYGFLREEDGDLAVAVVAIVVTIRREYWQRMLKHERGLMIGVLKISRLGWSLMLMFLNIQSEGAKY